MKSWGPPHPRSPGRDPPPATLASQELGRDFFLRASKRSGSRHVVWFECPATGATYHSAAKPGGLGGRARPGKRYCNLCNKCFSANNFSHQHLANLHRPSRVEGLGVSQESDGAIHLRWAEAQDNGVAISHYRLTCSADAGASWHECMDTAATDVTIGAELLQPRVAYCFRVSAVNLAGAGAESEVTPPVGRPTLPSAAAPEPHDPGYESEGTDATAGARSPFGESRLGELCLDFGEALGSPVSPAALSPGCGAHGFGVHVPGAPANAVVTSPDAGAAGRSDAAPEGCPEGSRGAPRKRARGGGAWGAPAAVHEELPTATVVSTHGAVGPASPGAPPSSPCGGGPLHGGAVPGAGPHGSRLLPHGGLHESEVGFWLAQIERCAHDESEEPGTGHTTGASASAASWAMGAAAEIPVARSRSGLQPPALAVAVPRWPGAGSPPFASSRAPEGAMSPYLRSPALSAAPGGLEAGLSWDPALMQEAASLMPTDDLEKFLCAAKHDEKPDPLATAARLFGALRGNGGGKGWPLRWGRASQEAPTEPREAAESGADGTATAELCPPSAPPSAPSSFGSFGPEAGAPRAAAARVASAEAARGSVVAWLRDGGAEASLRAISDQVPDEAPAAEAPALQRSAAGCSAALSVAPSAGLREALARASAEDKTALIQPRLLARLVSHGAVATARLLLSHAIAAGRSVDDLTQGLDLLPATRIGALVRNFPAAAAPAGADWLREEGAPSAARLPAPPSPGRPLVSLFSSVFASLGSLAAALPPAAPSVAPADAAPSVAVATVARAAPHCARAAVGLARPAMERSAGEARRRSAACRSQCLGSQRLLGTPGLSRALSCP